MSSSKTPQTFFKNHYSPEDFYSFASELSKIVISFSDFIPRKYKIPECEKDAKYIKILKKN
jgi:hypothetical protein